MPNFENVSLKSETMFVIFQQDPHITVENVSYKCETVKHFFNTLCGVLLCSDAF